MTIELPPDINKYSPKELHGMGSSAREEDNLLLALQLLDYAVVGYQKTNDYVGIVGALGDRGLTWKHYYLLTDDEVFAIFAKKDAESRLAIVETKGLKDKLSTSHFLLGEVEMLFEDYSSAISQYKKSLEYYEGSLSERGDYRYHLGEALYRNGQKIEGKKVILKGLSEIQEGASEVSDFLIHVWESGCNMRLADLLREDQPKDAKRYLSKAKKIIEGDKRLVIRKRQVKDLEKSLSF